MHPLGARPSVLTNGSSSPPRIVPENRCLIVFFVNNQMTFSTIVPTTFYGFVIPKEVLVCVGCACVRTTTTTQLGSKMNIG